MPNLNLSAKTLIAAPAAFLLSLPAAPTFADNFLMFGPSLAIQLQNDQQPRVPSSAHQGHFHDPSTLGGDGAPFVVDESHFATDAGHNVTIVDANEWSTMTTEEFAAFDAIVIGDAGCDFDDGSLLDPVKANKATWSPAVTGHLFLHTFDPIYHFNQNEATGASTSPEQLQAMVDLSVGGMEFAASAGSTGLYYAAGCRFFGQGDIEFLSLLAPVNPLEGRGDGVEIVEADHPVMTLFTNEALSDWLQSFHSSFGAPGDLLEVLAKNAESAEAIIIATPAPLGNAIVFADGFESGLTARWTSSTGEVSP